MKRVLIVLLAITAFIACNNEERPITKPNANIEFSEVTTRTSDDIDINEFGVWGAYYDIANPTGGYTSLFDNTKVTRVQSGENEWTYGKVRYWPLASHVYFVASYPYSDVAEFTTSEISYDSANYVSYSLYVETPETVDLDILTAKKYVNTEVDIPETVDLLFTHLMTRVNFKIMQDFDKNENDDFFISKFTISGIRNSGTYNIMPYESENGTNHFYTSWEMNDTRMTLVKEYANPIKLRGQEFLLVFDEASPMLIPQTIFSQEVKITINYLFQMADSDELEERELVAYLPASDIWASGHSITYTMRVAEKHDITFMAPTVEPWGAPQQSGTIIIK